MSKRIFTYFLTPIPTSFLPNWPWTRDSLMTVRRSVCFKRGESGRVGYLAEDLKLGFSVSDAKRNESLLKRRMWFASACQGSRSKWKAETDVKLRLKDFCPLDPSLRKSLANLDGKDFQRRERSKMAVGKMTAVEENGDRKYRLLFKEFQ